MGSHQKGRKNFFSWASKISRNSFWRDLTDIAFWESPSQAPEGPMRADPLLGSVNEKHFFLKLYLWPFQVHCLLNCPMLKRFSWNIEQRAVDMASYVQSGNRWGAFSAAGMKWAWSGLPVCGEEGSSGCSHLQAGISVCNGRNHPILLTYWVFLTLLELELAT